MYFRCTFTHLFYLDWFIWDAKKRLLGWIFVHLSWNRRSFKPFHQKSPSIWSASMLSRQRTIRFYYVLKLTTKIWALSKRFFYDAKLFESSFNTAIHVLTLLTWYGSDVSLRFKRIQMSLVLLDQWAPDSISENFCCRNRNTTKIRIWSGKFSKKLSYE